MNKRTSLLVLQLSLGCSNVCWAQAEPDSNADAPAPVADLPAGDASVAADPESAAAREAVLRATVRFDAADFRGAALEFERAYKLLSAGPRRNAVLNNLAVCYERMFAYDDALVSYERYLREAEPSAEDRAEVQRIARGLRDLLGGLQVSSSATAARVWIDDHERGAAPLDVRLTAGAHVVELRAPGYRSLRKSVAIHARQAQRLRIELERDTHFEGLHRGYFLGGSALTLGALAVGAGYGVRALHAHDRGQARARDELATVADEARVRRLSTSADIAFGAAALFGVSSLVLAFLTDWHPRAAAISPDRARALTFDLLPAAHARGGVLRVAGTLP